jgi:hypothetical protein
MKPSTHGLWRSFNIKTIITPEVVTSVEKDLVGGGEEVELG